MFMISSHVYKLLSDLFSDLSYTQQQENMKEAKRHQGSKKLSRAVDIVWGRSSQYIRAR